MANAKPTVIAVEMNLTRSEAKALLRVLADVKAGSWIGGPREIQSKLSHIYDVLKNVEGL